MLNRLRRFRGDGGYARWTKATNWPLTALAVLFVVVLVLPILASDLAPGWRATLAALNALIWAAFAVDYFTRLYLALDRRRFARSHVLDLIIVVVPFFRPLRLLRLLKLTAIVGVFTRRAEHGLHGRATVAVIASAVFLMFAGAAAIFDAERGNSEANIRTFGDALWWAAVTVATVGYGDRYPTTTTGRFVAFGLMLVGISLLGVVTGAVATWFVRQASESHEADNDAELDRVHAENQRLREHVERVEAKLDAISTKLDRLGGEQPS